MKKYYGLLFILCMLECGSIVCMQEAKDSCLGFTLSPHALSPTEEGIFILEMPEEAKERSDEETSDNEWVEVASSIASPTSEYKTLPQSPLLTLIIPPQVPLILESQTVPPSPVPEQQPLSSHPKTPTHSPRTLLEHSIVPPPAPTIEPTYPSFPSSSSESALSSSTANVQREPHRMTNVPKNELPVLISRSAPTICIAHVEQSIEPPPTQSTLNSSAVLSMAIQRPSPLSLTKPPAGTRSPLLNSQGSGARIIAKKPSGLKLSKPLTELPPITTTSALVECIFSMCITRKRVVPSPTSQQTIE